MFNPYAYLLKHAHSKQKFLKAVRIFHRLFLVLLLLLACSTYSFAATAAGYSEYYIPGSEDSMSLALRSFGPTPTNNTHALITITAWSDSVTIYYDHWEDGIDFDPDNPAATADETFTLATTGAILTLDNTPGGGIPIPRDSADTYYDGGDRIYVAGGAVTIARVSWLEARGRAIQAVAWEIYPVKPQLTTYVLPFGENLSATFTDFLGTYVLVQATADNTTFTVDLDGDGTPDPLDQNFDGDTLDGGDTTVVTLQSGESFFLGNVPVNPVPMPLGARATMNSGAIIQGSSTLQVKFIVGDPAANYETRGLSAFPRGYWTRDYYAPVGEPANATITDIFLYNPHPYSINVNWETQSGSGSFTISAGATVSYIAAAGALPVGGGVYLSGSDEFWGVSTVDSTGQVNEWAYSLLPSSLLYDDHSLGWAPGGADGNDSGVFLTVVQDNTRVFVDTDNDGTPDQTYTLNRLQSQYITDPTDGDLSGARFWATGQFTMAFGQNPDTAPAQATSGDLGYVSIPGTDFISLVLTVDKAVSPQVVPTASGSVATFTIKVNSQKYTVDGVNVTDYLPPNWQYLTGTDTTTITWPDKSTHSTDPSISGVPATGQTLSWTSSDLGTSGTPGMAENQEVTITFTARTTVDLTAGDLSQNRVKAVGTRLTGTPEEQTFTATDFAHVVAGEMSITKAASASGPLYPGDQFTYTVTVTNPVSATANQTGLSIYDPLPAGVSYVAGSSLVTGWLTTTPTDNVLDNFGSQAYNNNNGTLNWAGNWVESDAAQDATADNVQITGGVLRLGGTSNIYRQVDLSTATSAALSLDYSTSGNVDNGEWAYIEVASSPSGPWTTVYSFQNDPAPNPGSVTNFNIPSGLWSSTTTVRFRTTGYDGSEYLYIDNVNISYVHTVTSLATNPGGNSPNFVSSSDGYFIAPGGTLTLTYDVLVDNPLAAGINDIINTAYVNSNEMVLSLGASVTDLVVNPSAGTADVGDRIWLDSDGDGVLDVGEPGLANVEVTLKDQFGTPLLTTITDGTGHYLFTGVTPGDGYYVEATSSTLPAGLQQSAPSGHTDNRTDPFNISNFSYLGNARDQFDNNAYDNSDGTTAWAADWTESDDGGGGAAGGNILVTGGQLRINNDNNLTTQSITRGIDLTGTGATTATLTFDYATSGNLETTDDIVLQYRVGGSGGFTTLATFTDDVTGTVNSGPINIPLADPANLTEIRFAILQAADFTGGTEYFYVDNVNVEYYSETTLTSYLDADLGYAPPSGTATFGDRVWSDGDGDGVLDPGEPGLAGVTVDLYLDDGDGLFEPGVGAGLDGNPVATTTTTAGGNYLFTGVSADGSKDYFIFANSTQTALTGFTATTGDPQVYTNVNPNEVILTLDLGFQNAAGTYSIKDRVWFDDNGNSQDDGETGIAGVTVDLLDASLNVIASTLTDANGYFTFNGVIGGLADYTVRVTDTDGVLTDYFGITAGAIAGEAAIDNLNGNLDFTVEPTEPSFGYDLSRTIGDTVFNDIGATNGVQDAGEPGISGVTVELFLDDGDGVFEPGTGDGSPVATMTTDANGKYLFSGLADAAYFIHIDDSQAALTGFTTLTTTDDEAAAGDQRQVAIAAGGNALDADFGYRSPDNRTVSGTIWDDIDSNGVIDGGESGLGSVTIDLLRGGIVIASTSTDASGNYSFTGLPSDAYTVRITDDLGILAGYQTVYEVSEGLGAPSYDGEENVDLTGGDNNTTNFGLKKPGVTLATLSDFRGYYEKGRLKIEWTTSSEIGTAGFFLFRLDEKTGGYKQINRHILPALLGSPHGGTYSLFDNGATSKKSNTYILIEVEAGGKRNTFGPFTAVAGGGNALENPGRSGLQAAEVFLGRAVARHTGKALTGDDAVVDEISNYSMKSRGISDREKAGIETAKAARKNSNFLRRLRSGETLKMSVSEKGLYYIDSSRISGLMGISPETAQEWIAEGTLTLGSRGRRVPYLSAEDGSGIFFYGHGLNNVYSKENIYWLYKGAGLKMDHRLGEGPAPSGYNLIAKTVHAEEDLMYLPTPDMDPETDYWFWGYLYVTPTYTALASKTFTIEAEGAAHIPATATLTVNLKGFTNTDANPDHHIRVSLLRGAETIVLGEGWLEGADTQPPLVIQFDQQLLSSGSNTIKVEAVLDPGVQYSAFYVDSFDLTYQKLPEANGNVFRFKAEGTEPLTVYGFTSPSVYVFDITNPNRPLVELATTVTDEGGSFSVSFAPVAAGARYLVATLDAAAADLDIWADVPSDLWSQENSADYIIIAPDELKEAVQVLADYRQAQGHQTKVVDIEDIMDEFNYGISSPWAIKDFLTYAHYSWAKAPKYTVLAGEGTYDYKNNLGAEDNLVPTMIVNTPDGLFPSDNFLADADGDHVPDAAIGRLPVLTAGELQDLINKIITYENTAGSHIILLADNGDKDGNYPADSDDLGLFVPTGFSVEKMYLPAFTAATIRNTLLHGISSGTFLVNYIGHGNPYQLADEGLLRMGDVSAMENNGRFFVLTALTCTAGQFAIPGYDLLSESLLMKKDGGAVAVWAPSGFGLNFLSKRLGEGFFSSAFSADSLTLGDSLLAAFRHYKGTRGADFSLDIYNLLGDPALRLVVDKP